MTYIIGERGENMDYYAHLNVYGTDQKLNEHLQSVAGICRGQIPSVVQFEDLDNSEIMDIAYWLGYFHDMGKYTDWFQQYLLEDINSSLSQHAHISAFYLYQFCNAKLFIDQNRMTKEAIQFLAYLCVRLHHGNLTMDHLFPSDRLEEMWGNLNTQSRNLVAKRKEIISDLNVKLLTIEDFIKFSNIEYLQNKSLITGMPHLLRTRLKNDKWYFMMIYFFSLLVDADKLDTARIQRNVPGSVAFDAVIDYLKRKHGDKNGCRQYEMNEFTHRKEEARSTIMSTIEDLSFEQVRERRLFTITAPTGLGKTLSALQGALRLRERISEIDGYIPRIITAIPFINIIEQTQKDYEAVFDGKMKIIVHHRMTELSNMLPANERIALDKALMEVESWEADIVLTTFVQLFQSLFTGKNRLLKKVNKLAGSIVILDEAQALPEKYMPLIGALIVRMSQYYGTRFILMTATQPKLIEFSNKLLKTDAVETMELLPNNCKYFLSLNRTKLIPVLERRQNISEFIGFFKEKWNPTQSALIVVNTIKRSIEVYKKLKEDLSGTKIFYLSTNIIPKKRKQVIELADKALKNNEAIIMVSTQTIEAGVDLDFDMGFRDLAPLESLVQTSGRVNRKNEKGYACPVYVIELESDNQYVYEPHHINETKKALQGNLKNNISEIPETEYRDLIDNYYRKALERDISQEAVDIWKCGIEGLNFEELGKFQLIQDIGEVADIYVECNQEASHLADVYEALLSENNPFDPSILEGIIDANIIKGLPALMDVFQRKALLRTIRAKMNSYIIQIRVVKLKANRPVDFKARNGALSSLFWIPPDQVEDYYDENTGFIDESGTAFL